WSLDSIPPPVNAHPPRIGRVLRTATAHEFPVVRPQPWIAEKVDHDARVTCVWGPEHDVNVTWTSFSQLVFRQASASEDLGRFGAIQPRHKLLVLGLVPAANPSNPDAGVFACDPFRRHL